MTAIFENLKFTQIPNSLGQGQLGIQIDPSLPLNGKIGFYSAEEIESMDATSVQYTKIDEQTVTSASDTYSINCDNANTAGFMAIYVDPEINLEANYEISSIPFDGVNGISTTSPNVSKAEAIAAKSSATQYANGLVNDIISGQRHFKDVPEADDILQDLISLGFPTDLITVNTESILDSYVKNPTGDFLVLMRHCELIRQHKEKGLDTTELESYNQCLTCRIVWGIALVTIITSIVAMIILFVATSIATGGGSTGLFVALTVQISFLVINGNSIVIANLIAALIIAMGTAVRIGVVAAQIPRIICEATGDCPPALGKWDGGDAISTLSEGPASLPSITGGENNLFVSYTDKNNLIRIATFNVEEETWDASQIVNNAPPSITSTTLTKCNGVYYLFATDTSHKVYYSTSVDCITWNNFYQMPEVLAYSPISIDVNINYGNLALVYADSSQHVTIVIHDPAGNWTNPAYLPTNPQCKYGPSIVYYRNVLYLGFRDQADGQLKFSYSRDGLSWHTPYILDPNKIIYTGSNLFMGACDDYLILQYEGWNSNAICWAWYDGYNLSGDQKIGVGTRYAQYGASGFWHEESGRFIVVWKVLGTNQMKWAIFDPNPLPQD